MAGYPDGVSGSDLCHMEGCVGRGRCPRCGSINYALMGYYGALARWAKAWGVSEREAEERIYADIPDQAEREPILPRTEGRGGAK